MIFRAAPFPARRRGLLTLAGLLLLVGLLLWLALTLPVSGLSFALLLASLALGALWLYLAWRAWACLSLGYWLDRNAVTVAWGPVRQVIPLPAIREVRRHLQLPPAEGRALLPAWLEEWLLYGHDLNKLRVVPRPGSGPAAATWRVVCLASRPLPEQLVLLTDHGAFGISPAQPEAFLAALEEHHQLGPTRLLGVERRRPPLWEAALWRDRWAVGLLAAGLVGGLALLGLVMARFPALPAQLPGAQGLNKSALFWLPTFGFAVWLINSLWGLLIYRGQRVGALLLWAGTLVGQAAALAGFFALT
ncbi:MAG: PH domain-containing protein [Caldilineales bacterium]|nr:PH domain-containing protein [Caldilineales bacterium]MDW8317523.1 hypothetical protein [Anaerolineae bacterium]